MIALGALAALGVFFLLCRRHKLSRGAVDNLILLIPVIILGGFFFAAAFDKIAHWGEAPFWQPAGMTFAGGFIGGAVLTLIFYPILVKKPNRDVATHFDILAPCVALAHAFGRVGCFLGGCCFGKPTDSFLGVVFPEGSPAFAHYGGFVRVWPTQLFEAFFLLLLFLALFFLVKKYRICIYLISYGVFRFFLEFLRGDNRGSLVPFLSPSQLLALVILAAGVGSVFLYRKYSKNPEAGRE